MWARLRESRASIDDESVGERFDLNYAHCGAAQLSISNEISVSQLITSAATLTHDA